MIKKEDHSHHAIIRFNRPEKYNALTEKMLDALLKAVQSYEKKKHIHAILIIGEGPHFCAGMDVSILRGASKAKARTLAKKGVAICTAIEKSTKIYMAALHGYCLGGGFEIALSCDLRIADRTLQCGVPEAKLGIVPGFGGASRIAALCGLHTAQELVLGNTFYDTHKAHHAGIVHRVVRQKLENHAVQWLLHAQQQSPIALGKSKKLLSDWFVRYDPDIQAFASCFQTKDQKQWMDLFLHKK